MTKEAIEALEWAISEVKKHADQNTIPGQMATRLIGKIEKLADKLAEVQRMTEGS